MAKVILILLAVHGVLGTPIVPIPFATYGVPTPETRGEIVEATPTVPEELPGVENFDQKPQLPDTLPGTENLVEKKIPDSITLRMIPAPPAVVSLPEFQFEGAFHRPGSPQGFVVPQFVKPETPVQPIQSEQSHPELPRTIVEHPVAPQVGVYPYPKYESGEEILSDAILPPTDDGPVHTPDRLVIPPGTKLKLEDDRGQYSHGFSSPDGTEVQETGHLITTNGGWEYVIAKEGSYSYTSPEGIPINVRYVADHNGFRITGQSFGRR